MRTRKNKRHTTSSNRKNKESLKKKKKLIERSRKDYSKLEIKRN